MGNWWSLGSECHVSHICTPALVMSASKQSWQRVQLAVLLVLCLGLATQSTLAQKTPAPVTVSPVANNTPTEAQPTASTPISPPVQAPSSAPVPVSGDQCVQCNPGTFSGTYCSEQVSLHLFQSADTLTCSSGALSTNKVSSEG